MGIIKKILLWGSIVIGFLDIVRQSKEYGFHTGLVLLTLFALATAFLWLWASGCLPAYGKLKAVLVVVVLALVGLGTVEIAMANELHVDLVEVVRTTLVNSPWFYLLMFAGAALKVFFWNWVFSDVRAKNTAKVEVAAQV
ncbi:hypothetical protein [Kluyvera sichuanensis]|uniref:hypothetical protein n=1 Tax=Kluyvera sichuanensis TaxID=2725494 RepID=UPI002FD087D0